MPPRGRRGPERLRAERRDATAAAGGRRQSPRAGTAWISRRTGSSCARAPPKDWPRCSQPPSAPATKYWCSRSGLAELRDASGAAGRHGRALHPRPGQWFPTRSRADRAADRFPDQSSRAQFAVESDRHRPQDAPSSQNTLLESLIPSGMAPEVAQAMVDAAAKAGHGFTDAAATKTAVTGGNWTTPATLPWTWRWVSTTGAAAPPNCPRSPWAPNSPPDRTSSTPPGSATCRPQGSRSGRSFPGAARRLRVQPGRQLRIVPPGDVPREAGRLPCLRRHQ